jgi:predicted XRE-type DNA-binding protein
MVNIYTLSDPATREIRYVGKTHRDLFERLHEHVGNCDRSTYHSANWIRGLRDSGVRPLIELLEVTDDDTWAERERHWISTLRERGVRLTNIQDGGEGAHGYHQTETHKAKIGLANRGERNGAAKLVPELAQQIKLLAIQKALTQKEIASIYGVSRRLVGKIANGQRWSHLPGFGVEDDEGWLW